MSTYNSAGSGNFNADATWTESGQPSTDDVAVIASGHTVTMTADASVGSIDIQGTLTTDGTARTLTLDDGGQGYICEHRGTVSTTINLTINSNFAGDRLIRLNNGGNGNFNNVSITLQSTSRKLTIGTEAASIGGNLTIAQGEFNTDSSNNYALTVGGELSNAGTFTGNSSTVTARNLLVTAGTFTAPDGSGSLILTGEGTSGSGDGYVFRRTGGTFTHSSGTLTITTPTTTSIRMGGVGSGQRFNNVILDESSIGLFLQTNDEGFYCEGDLTLTDGDFNLNTNVDLLTVEGNVTVGANNTLGGITSTQTTDNSFGSLTIASGGEYNATSGTTEITSEAGTGYAVDNSGTFTHNSGTLEVGYASNSFIKLGSSVNNLTIRAENSVVKWVDNTTIAGDVVIIEGVFQPFNNAFTIDVNGDVSIQDGGTLGVTDSAQAYEFGSLTIASGATFIATSGTTTITSRTGGSGTYALENNGTFTHNKGTVAITDADNVVSMGLGSSLYNLTLSGGSKKIRNNTTINNNLTLTSGDLYGHSGSLTLDVLGQTILNGGTTGQNIAFSGTMNWGNVTVNSGTLKLSSGTNNAESFRNVGGTIQ